MMRDKGGIRVAVKKLVAVIGVLALVSAIGLFVAGTTFAQESTPTPTPAPKVPFGCFGWGRGFGFWGGSTAVFDAVAEALNLTPTQLFEQLHSGKTLSEIAEAQGVDLQKVQDAINAAQKQVMKDAINQALKAGRISQAEADWLLQGLEQGFLPKGRGFGFGHMRGGLRGPRGWWGPAPTTTPTPSGTTS